MSVSVLCRVVRRGFTFACLLAIGLSTLPGAMAQDAMLTGNTVLDALLSGKAELRARYRFERVSQAGFSRKASANSLLLRPGYSTGEAFGFSARIDLDTIMQIGKERFNDTVNGNTIYPVIADSDTVELNQAFLKFKGIPKTTLIGGRQRIKLDNDRFVGNVGFRQNEQTFDAATVINRSIDHLELRTTIWTASSVFLASRPSPVISTPQTTSFTLRISAFR